MKVLLPHKVGNATDMTNNFWHDSILAFMITIHKSHAGRRGLPINT